MDAMKRLEISRAPAAVEASRGYHARSTRVTISRVRHALLLRKRAGNQTRWRISGVKFIKY